MLHRLTTYAAAALVAMTVAVSVRADEVLFDFAKGFDVTKVVAVDAKPTLDVGVMRIATFHEQTYPGVTLAAPKGKWDLSAHQSVAVDVKNAGETAVTVHCRVDNPGADGTNNCCTGSITLKGGEPGTLKVQLSRRSSSDLAAKLFGMRGYPAGFDPKGRLDVANVTQLLFFVAQPKVDHLFEIRNVRATGAFVAANVKPDRFLPFIDEFGQYMHTDWPGKVHSVAEIQQKLDEEAQEMGQKPGPTSWDKWGGWNAGPTLKATGSFRVEKHQSKWWIVDPDGKLFFSHGVDCVRMLDITPIDGRDAWFKDFPGRDGQYKEFLVGRAFALHGYYAGKSPQCYGFAAANFKRKYGENWRDATAQIAHQRLRSWGLNTIANWSASEVYLMQKTPYVCTVGSGGKMIEGSQGYWGKFPDPFDAQFKEQTRQRIRAATQNTANDPWCIGYFVDNEMSWGDELSLGIGSLASPLDQTAKQVLVADLRIRYGTIAKLNDAWGTTHASWDALLESRQPPDKQKARADLTAFYTKTAEEYFKVVRESLKAAAPNRLYLGCRFAWVNPLAVAAAVRHCDVVSYNLYSRSVADFRPPGDADVPLIIGEFHFGALDRGVFHTGLVPTGTQEERARMYKEYVQGALRHPQFVGTHWFQYQDEPTTGRVYDEENYQIGLIDTADTPYRETIEAVREVGYGMYEYRSAK